MSSPGVYKRWGFDLYLASSDKHENQILPTDSPPAAPEEALDCACGLYHDHLT